MEVVQVRVHPEATIRHNRMVEAEVDRFLVDYADRHSLGNPLAIDPSSDQDEDEETEV